MLARQAVRTGSRLVGVSSHAARARRYVSDLRPAATSPSFSTAAEVYDVQTPREPKGALRAYPLKTPAAARSAARGGEAQPAPAPKQHTAAEPAAPAESSSSPAPPKPVTTSAEPAAPKRRPLRPLRARKAAMSLSADAVRELRRLLDMPEPKLIKVGVKQKGCSGLTYDLEYVEAPGKMDEVVEQDGVRIVVDSRALMSIIGSEMHWEEDLLSQKFVFRNPNIKQACGCGESFMV